MAHPIYGNIIPAWVYALRVFMALFIMSAPYGMVTYLTKAHVSPLDLAGGDQLLQGVALFLLSYLVYEVTRYKIHRVHSEQSSGRGIELYVSLCMLSVLSMMFAMLFSFYATVLLVFSTGL